MEKKRERGLTESSYPRTIQPELLLLLLQHELFVSQATHPSDGQFTEATETCREEKRREKVFDTTHSSASPTPPSTLESSWRSDPRSRQLSS